MPEANCAVLRSGLQGPKGQGKNLNSLTKLHYGTVLLRRAQVGFARPFCLLQGSAWDPDP